MLRSIVSNWGWGKNKYIDFMIFMDHIISNDHIVDPVRGMMIMFFLTVRFMAHGFRMIYLNIFDLGNL